MDLILARPPRAVMYFSRISSTVCAEVESGSNERAATTRNLHTARDPELTRERSIHRMLEGVAERVNGWRAVRTNDIYPVGFILLGERSAEAVAGFQFAAIVFGLILLYANFTGGPAKVGRGPKGINDHGPVHFGFETRPFSGRRQRKIHRAAEYN